MKPVPNQPVTPEAEPAAPAVSARPDPAALAKEFAAQNESYLRLEADFDSFKRRSRLELATRAGAEKESFITELLPVVDSLERALVPGSSAESARLREGVEITLKQLQQLLRQHGVESTEQVGQRFDPHRQEALAQGHDPTRPDHTILQVLRRGYARGESVLRAANVVVNDLSAVRPLPDGR